MDAVPRRRCGRRGSATPRGRRSATNSARCRRAIGDRRSAAARPMPGPMFGAAVAPEPIPATRLPNAARPIGPAAVEWTAPSTSVRGTATAAITVLAADDRGRSHGGERRRDVETHPAADRFDRRRRAALDATVRHRRGGCLRRGAGPGREVRGDERRPRLRPLLRRRLGQHGAHAVVPVAAGEPVGKIAETGWRHPVVGVGRPPERVGRRDGRGEQRVAGDLQRLPRCWLR